MTTPRDELTKKNKKPNYHSRSSSREGRCSPARRPTKRQANRSDRFSFLPVEDGYYISPNVFYRAPEARVSSVETGTKLYISNLDYGVTDEDIRILFSDLGDLKRYSIHYDSCGRSKGTAEVVFSRKEHALAAMELYNNVRLDGMPMKTEVVGMNIEKPVAFPVVPNNGFDITIGISRNGYQVRRAPLVRALGGVGGRSGGRRGGCGRRRGRGRRGRGRGKNCTIVITMAS